MKKRKRLNLKSYAKINLFLDVLSKQTDGFHQIRTIFSEIDLFDELNFTLTEKDGVKILSNKDFVSMEDNLIYKIAIFIKEQYNVQYGVEIKLIKNIPVAAGLGGGSSNAATSIFALSRLWELDLSAEEMNSIARKFGSDINFFLYGGTALGTGRGEKITPMKNINLTNIFLVNPGFRISSKEAYKSCIVTEENEDWEKFPTCQTKFYYNKLQEGLIPKYQEIKKIIQEIKDHGAGNAILSGSGATIIGFCPNRDIAQKLSKLYSKKKYWNTITKTKKRRTKWKLQMLKSFSEKVIN